MISKSSNIIMIPFAFMVNFTVYFSGLHNVAASKFVAIDTIPGEKIILYREDSEVRNDGKSKYLSNLARNLSLPSLENRKIGEYIRVWLWNYQSSNYTITIAREGVNARCSAISWSATKKDSLPAIIVHNTWNNLTPKSGWNKFLSKLDGFGITTLGGGLSFSQHKGHLTRMSYIQFEIVENGKYRYYEYLEPAYYRYVEDGSKKVYEFLKYFNSEMNIPFYKTDDKLFEKP